MANQRGGSTGRFVTPEVRGRVSDAVPAVPLDDGTLGRQVAGVFGTLARDLGALADQAALTQASEAGTAAGMAAGGRTTTDPPPTGSPPAESARVAPSPDGAAALKAAYRGSAGGLEGLDGDFSSRLGAFLAANPGVTINSAFRTPERQAELYRAAVAEHGSEAEARKWVAPPGRSRHNHGAAADLAFASPEARRQAHDSAARFGLHFPLANEAWHIEPAGSRDGPAATGTPAAPAEPPRPLALRRDGTRSGAAFDEAARRAFGYRLDANLRADIAAAAEANREDPAGLAKALDTVRGRFLASGSFDDPELAALLDRRFTDMAWTARQSVAANFERRQADAAQAAGAESLAATELDLTRQARAIGANPDGDAVLGRLLERGDRQIDSLVQDRVLTPEGAVRAKAGLRRSVIAERVGGTYAALPDDAARDRFADGLLSAWDKGDGAIASLPRDVVEGIVSRAASDRAARTRAAGAARAGWEQALDDDLASVGATGQPVAYQGQPLTQERIAAALGPDKAAAWAGGRRQALAIHTATADLDTLPEDGIAERLHSLEPAPGSPGFAEAEKLASAARQRAMTILKQRREDPAAAVDGAIPRDPEAPPDPATLTATRMRLQAGLGIPEDSRRPLTKAEAAGLADRIRSAPDPGAAFLTLAAGVSQSYGGSSGAVLEQVTRAAGAGGSKWLSDALAGPSGAAVLPALVAPGRPGLDALAADAAVMLFKDDRLPVETRTGAVLSVLEAASGRAGALMQRLRDAGLPDLAVPALEAGARDRDPLRGRGALRRLMAAATLDPEKLPATVKAADLNGKIAEFLFSGGGKGRALYGARPGNPDGIRRATAAADLARRAIRLRVAQGESLDDAARSTFRDILGPVTSVPSGLDSRSEAVVPDGVDAGRVAAGLDGALPKVRAAMLSGRDALLKRLDPATSAPAVVTAAADRHIADILESGLWINARTADGRDGFAFLDPYSGQPVADASGAVLVVPLDDALSDGDRVPADRSFGDPLAADLQRMRDDMGRTP